MTPDPITPAQMRELVATLLADQWVDYKDYPKDRDIAHALESAADQITELKEVLRNVTSHGEDGWKRAHAMEKERDLAIAHDTQPYPTAWAYNAACCSLETQRNRAVKAENDLAYLKGEYVGAVDLLKAAEAKLASAEKALTQAMACLRSIDDSTHKGSLRGFIHETLQALASDGEGKP